MRRGDGELVDGEFDVASDQVDRILRRALVRNVVEFDAGLKRKQFGGEMTDGADAGRAVVDLAGLGLGQRDEFLDVARGQARVQADATGAARNQHDGDQVAQRVVRHGVAHAGCDGQRPGIAGEQGVAVGGAFDHGFGAGYAAGARPVVDDELLAEGSGELLRRPARLVVGGAGGHERHDDAHRFRRISLCSGRRHQQCQCQNAERGCGFHGLLQRFACHIVNII